VNDRRPTRVLIVLSERCMGLTRLAFLMSMMSMMSVMP
jgi:hypothetical protein